MQAALAFTMDALNWKVAPGTLLEHFQIDLQTAW